MKELDKEPNLKKKRNEKDGDSNLALKVNINNIHLDLFILMEVLVALFLRSLKHRNGYLLSLRAVLTAPTLKSRLQWQAMSFLKLPTLLKR